jgi:hypothetical protein
MKFKRLCIAVGLSIGFLVTSSTNAQTVITWTGGDGDFFDKSNWDSATVPKAKEVALINNGKTATIGANSGTNDKNHAGVNNLDWEVGEKGLGRFEMHSGLTYANIHTAANGGGEIRGQLNLSP